MKRNDFSLTRALEEMTKTSEYFYFFLGKYGKFSKTKILREFFTPYRCFIISGRSPLFDFIVPPSVSLCLKEIAELALRTIWLPSGGALEHISKCDIQKVVASATQKSVIPYLADFLQKCTIII